MTAARVATGPWHASPTVDAARSVTHDALMRIGRILPLVAVGLFLLPSAPVAMAGTPVVECVFDAPSAVATVTPADGAATIAVDAGSLTVDAVACGAATVTTTDTIQVQGDGSPDVTISLAGGAFAPGLTDEGDDSSEIEFVFTPGNGDLTIEGSPGADSIAGWFDAALGPTISLNADEATIDADIDLHDAPGLTTVQLAGGDDAFTGLREGEPPYTGALFVHGAAGDDEIVPGLPELGQSFYFGGQGTDTLSVATIDPSCTAVYLQQAGIVQCTPVGFSFSGGVFERLIGHAGVDWLGGSARLIEARGRGGDDQLFAGPGDGLLNGGAGRDFAAFAELDVPRGVLVDLRAGFARGDGIDTLTSIENIYGSTGGDVLLGDGTANEIHGLDGDDVLRGRKGVDVLDGGLGSDTCVVGLPGTGEATTDCEG